MSKRKNTPPNAIYLPDDTMADCKSHIVYSECEISLWIRRHRRIVLIRAAPTSPHFANTIYMLGKNSDFANFPFLCEGSAWNEIVLFGETTVLCFRIYYPPTLYCFESLNRTDYSSCFNLKFVLVCNSFLQIFETDKTVPYALGILKIRDLIVKNFVYSYLSRYRISEQR